MGRWRTIQRACSAACCWSVPAARNAAASSASRVPGVAQAETDKVAAARTAQYTALVGILCGLEPLAGVFVYLDHDFIAGCRIRLVELEGLPAERPRRKVRDHKLDVLVLFGRERRDKINQPDFVPRVPVVRREYLTRREDTAVELLRGSFVAISPECRADRLILVAENPQLLFQEGGHRDDFESRERQLPVQLRLCEKPGNLAQKMTYGRWVLHGTVTAKAENFLQRTCGSIPILHILNVEGSLPVNTTSKSAFFLRSVQILSSLVLVSCSSQQDERNSDWEGALKIEQCLNEELTGNGIDFLTVDHVTSENGEKIAFSLTLSQDAGQDGPGHGGFNSDVRIVAATLSENVRRTIYDRPPRSRADYESLIPKIGLAAYLKLNDLVRSGALSFETPSRAVVQYAGVDVPTYLIFDHDWAFSTTEERGPDFIPFERISEGLRALEKVNERCPL